MTDKLKVYRKDSDLYSGEIIAFYSKRVVLGDESNDFYSYVENDIRIAVGEDGHLSVSDQNRDGIVYFHPDQMQHLKSALDIALHQIDVLRIKAKGGGE